MPVTSPMRAVSAFGTISKAMRPDTSKPIGASVQQGTTEDFVDGVMTTDVFADRHEISRGFEKGGGVEATGGVEGGLGGVKSGGQAEVGAVNFGRSSPHRGAQRWPARIRWWPLPQRPQEEDVKT